MRARVALSVNDIIGYWSSDTHVRLSLSKSGFPHMVFHKLCLTSKMIFEMASGLNR